MRVSRWGTGNNCFEGVSFMRKSLAFLAFLTVLSTTSLAQTYTFTVDATANRQAINPLIYGVAYATQAQLIDLGATLNRLGGDPMTRYNWNINADNRCADYFFESIGDASAVAGYRGDAFIQGDEGANAQTMITIPTIGWVAKLGTNRATISSFSVAKYGPQTATDEWDADAGNGISTKTGHPFITGNDPNDADVPSDVAFQQPWITHMVTKWGTAAKGGVKYYLMDNEPSIWFSSHRDVHPVGAKMDEVLGDILNYGAAVKNEDPSALVVGPEEWGWSGYFESGYDQQTGGTSDRAAHNNMDYIPYLLKSIAASDATSKRRTLDVLSLHIYPQDGSNSNDCSPAALAIRNSSTRSLWDPTYVEQSWINTDIDLIPRMKAWVNSYYPGTLIGITEYNWGAEPYMSGATAQADIDGILGWQGVNLATRWTTPDPSTPTYKAMKMYRNYDGLNHGFGDVSVSDTGTTMSPNNLTSYAATRTADGSLTITVINKVLTQANVNINLLHFVGNNTAQVWQLTPANLIRRNVDLIVRNSVLAGTVPAQSVTIFVLPPSTVAETKPGPIAAIAAYGYNGKTTVNWTGGAGATYYRVYRSTTAGATTGYSVLGIVYVPTYTDTAVTNGTTYYYKVEAVDPVGPSAPSAAAAATPMGANPDTSQYNFETSAQGWTTSGGLVGTPATSATEHFVGYQSLAVPITATKSDSQNAYVLSPTAPAGATVTFHVWIPSGCLLSAIQPYVQQGASGGWTFTGTYTALSALKTNAWNTITVTVPTNAVTPLYELGVEFDSSVAWTGTCYVDSVSWPTTGKAR
ncbi:MAG TPA: glycoside hydrolase family 44 protein [Fimbriimonadaceae bacterium]